MDAPEYVADVIDMVGGVPLPETSDFPELHLGTCAHSSSIMILKTPNAYSKDPNDRPPYQILPHTNSYFHCVYSYLDLLQ